MLVLERETRVELATLCLGSRCSTTELLPLGPMMAWRRGGRRTAADNGGQQEHSDEVVAVLHGRMIAEGDDPLARILANGFANERPITG